MSIKFSKKLGIFAFVCVFSLFALCGAEAADYPTPENPLVIELATTARYNPGLEAFSSTTDSINKLLKMRTKGAIQFEFKGGGQLANTEMDMVNGLKIQTIESTTVSFSNLEANIPELTVLSLPYLFVDDDQILDFMLNAPVMKKLNAIVEERYNCVNICTSHAGGTTFANNVRPMLTPEDVKGLKLRIQDSVFLVKLLTLLGGNPTPMNINDAIVAIQQGTIDGLQTAFPTLYTTGMYEFLKYSSLTNHAYLFHCFLVRKDIFEKCSPEQQAILLEVGRTVTAIEHERVHNNDKRIRELLEAGGTKVNDVPDYAPWREVLAPMYQGYREQMGEDIFKETMEYLNVPIQ